MQIQIKKFRAERHRLMNRVKQIDNAIKAFQEVCEHKHEDGRDAFEEHARDSHHTWYKCAICGHETND